MGDEDQDDLLDELENIGEDREAMETAVELGKLLAEDTGLCCSPLARIVYGVYRRLKVAKGAEL